MEATPAKYQRVLRVRERLLQRIDKQIKLVHTLKRSLLLLWLILLVKAVYFEDSSKYRRQEHFFWVDLYDASFRIAQQAKTEPQHCIVE